MHDIKRPAMAAPFEVAKTQYNRGVKLLALALSAAVLLSAGNDYVAAVLKKRLDAAQASAGDVMEIQTTSAANLPSGMSLPKNTRLTGKVIAAGPGQLVVSLDTAATPDGRQIPIHGIIRSISAPSNLQVFNSTSGNFGEYGSPGQPPPGVAPVALAGTIDGAGGTAHPGRGTPAPGVNGRGPAPRDNWVVGRVRGYSVGLTANPSTGESTVRSLNGRAVALDSGTTLTLTLSASN